MKTRLIMFFISVFSLIFIINLSRSIYALWQKRGIVAERRSVAGQLAQKNQELVQKSQEVESEPFIEKQAREKLNLQREGEVVVVLPKNLGVIENTPPPPQSPNWQRWWKVFF